MTPSIPRPTPAGRRRRGSTRGVAIQRLTFADLPQVLAIERRSYRAPWSLAMFVLETAKPSGLCVVARAFGTGQDARPPASTIVGYAIVSRYDDAFHVMNICVEPNRRREGIARTLLEHVIDRAGGDAARMTLEVRPSNVGARALYDGHGFLSVGTRRRYYRDDNEDALIMWRTPATLRGLTHDIPGAPAAEAGPVADVPGLSRFRGRGRRTGFPGSGGPVPPDVPAPSSRRPGR